MKLGELALTGHDISGTFTSSKYRRTLAAVRDFALSIMKKKDFIVEFLKRNDLCFPDLFESVA